MIDKNTENSTQELNLFPIKGKNIELSFSGDSHFESKDFMDWTGTNWLR
jgi:hypothetical protein